MKYVIRVYKILFQYFPHARWQVLLRGILTVLMPLIESAIPAMALAMILEHNVSRYMIGISVLLIADVLVRISGNVLENRDISYTLGVGMLYLWPSYLNKCLTMDYCHVEPAKMQDKMQKGMNAINGDRLGVRGLFYYSFSFLSCVLGIFSYGVIITMVDFRIISVILAMSVAGFFLHRHAVRYSDAHTQERDRANRGVAQMTWEARMSKYGKDVRIYHMENWFRELFDVFLKRLMKWYGKTELRWFFPTISDTLFGVVRDLLMYLVLIENVINGNMTVAEMTFYIGVVSGLSSWLNHFMFQLSGLMKCYTESKAWFEEMEMEDVFLHGEGEKLNDSEPVCIEFRDVSFSYEEGAEILSHMSFRIEKGQKIALVGNNGAGKSTIVKLLCGFYLPTKGEILINGIPTGQYDVDNYRQGIAAVFQDGYIAAFTIAENVAGGKKDRIDYKKVRDCLKKAGIWEKIEKLPQKEKTYISQQLESDGVDFSGGERQKILIARAYYQEGRLLLLDEPTSALDPIAESHIYEKYNEMTNGKTAIFISHRLASTRFCDEILYMENGKIKERGTHEQLMKKGGSYAGMFQIQSQYYREETDL